MKDIKSLNSDLENTNIKCDSNKLDTMKNHEQQDISLNLYILCLGLVIIQTLTPQINSNLKNLYTICFKDINVSNQSVRRPSVIVTVKTSKHHM